MRQFIAPPVEKLVRSRVLDKTDVHSASTVRTVWKCETLEQLEEFASQYWGERSGEADALEEIHAHDSLRARKLQALGFLLQSDVEYLGRHKRTGADVDYLNAGDTYAVTLIAIGDRLVIGCWGDLVESGSVQTYDSHNGGLY